MASLTLSRAQHPLVMNARGSRQRLVVRAAAKTATKATAYICVDCGYIYDGREAFDKLPSSYRCPVCNAPKRRCVLDGLGGQAYACVRHTTPLKERSVAAAVAATRITADSGQPRLKLAAMTPKPCVRAWMP